MSVEYRLDVKTAAGVMAAQITDFYELSYSKKVNEAGLLTFRLDGDHPAIPYFEHRGQIEVWRRDPANGIGWYIDFYGLYMKQRRETKNVAMFTASCPGLLAMLGWRYVLYFAGTVNRTEFTNAKAETAMKTLVDYNAGPNATTGSGRMRNGAITGLTIETDGARGTTQNLSCSWRNLLTVLQDLAPAAGGDFDVVKTGAATWQFKFYSGQRGTDHTADVLFSLDRGNMANATYTLDRIDEKTVAIIGGQGEGSARAVQVVTGDDYSAFNDIEIFTDARNSSTAAGLQDEGKKKLRDTKANAEFTFDVVQIASCLYGKHYDLGDLVTGQYDTIKQTRKVVGVNVSADSDGGDTIKVEMGNYLNQ
jgi:hypothetical protein